MVKNPDCIEPQFKRHGGKTYGRYMLHRAPLFNVTSVVWGPGDGAKAHNHDTWGLVGVVENELQETRFKRRDDGTKEGYAELELTGVNSNKAGMVSTLVAPDNDIHEMLNTTQKNTVEVHVYGKDLANMQRLQFDIAQSLGQIFRQRQVRQLLRRYAVRARVTAGRPYKNRHYRVSVSASAPNPSNAAFLPYCRGLTATIRRR